MSVGPTPPECNPDKRWWAASVRQWGGSRGLDSGGIGGSDSPTSRRWGHEVEEDSRGLAIYKRGGRAESTVGQTQGPASPPKVAIHTHTQQRAESNMM